MRVSENVLKWALRFYPPLLLQRIWIIEFKKDFKGIRVKIAKSLLNKNYNDSIFGGTLFCAADPFFPVMFHQIFLHKGYKVVAWSKSAEIQFLKPAATNMRFELNIDDEEIIEAEEQLNACGKYIRLHPVNILDKYNDVCVTVKVEVYIRNINYQE